MNFGHQEKMDSALQQQETDKVSSRGVTNQKIQQSSHLATNSQTHVPVLHSQQTTFPSSPGVQAFQQLPSQDFYMSENGVNDPNLTKQHIKNTLPYHYQDTTVSSSQYSQDSNSNHQNLDQKSVFDILPGYSLYQQVRHEKKEEKKRKEEEKRREKEKALSQKMQGYDVLIAAEKAETEMIEAARRKKMREKKEQREEQEKVKQQRPKALKNEYLLDFLQMEIEKKRKEDEEAEREHQRKMQIIEEQRLKEEKEFEAEIQRIKNLPKNNVLLYDAECEKLKAINKAKMDSLQSLLQKLKEERNQSWMSKSVFEDEIISMKAERQKEEEERRRQEDASILKLKQETEAILKKQKEIEISTKALVVPQSKQDPGYWKPESDVKNFVPIKLKHSKMQIIDDLKVSSSPTSIGIIGLPKTGRSTLIGALMGGIWPETLNENPVITINKIPIYKLSYPNNGFIQGSVNENREIYQNYFINSQLLNLSALVICISENVREEDLLVFSIASDYHIPTIIARTKLDQWLHNLPQNKTKNDYIEGDKKYVSCEFRELGLNISSSIKIAEGSGTHMMKYLCDDKKLREYLKLENENVRENEAMSSVDVLVLGLNRAGKSAIIDGLKSKFANISFGEQNYDETMSVDTVICKAIKTNARLFCIVIPNTVGRIDARLIEYFTINRKYFIVLLTRSDEMIHNLKQQSSSIDMEDYINQRHEAATIEFKKLHLDYSTISMFTVSGFRLVGYLDESFESEEQKLLTFFDTNF